MSYMVLQWQNAFSWLSHKLHLRHLILIRNPLLPGKSFWLHGICTTFLAPLPEHQAEQDFRNHPLEGIEPAAPTILQAAVPDQAEQQHREGGDHVAFAEAVAAGELVIGSGEQLVGFLLEIPLLARQPAAEGLAVVVEDGLAHRQGAAPGPEAMGMAIVDVVAAIGTEQVEAGRQQGSA